jgi:hypothetical protein
LLALDQTKDGAGTRALTAKEEMEPAMECKGMVQFAGATYRIVKVHRGKYDVYRLLDDVRIGDFESAPKLRVKAAGIDEKLLLEIALTALREAKVTWVRRSPL